MYTKACIEQLKQAVSLHEIVEKHVQLKRRGTTWTGLCPFHNEKTPSFTVKEGRFHCFGCGQSGDIFTFLTLKEGLSFFEAVQHLAQKYNISLTYTEGAEADTFSARKAGYAVLQSAQDFFIQERKALRRDTPAFLYLKERGLDGAAYARFRLGWAPDGGGALLAHFKKQGVDMETLRTYGLVKNQPLFRRRIMFPIHDGLDRVIAFSGRKIDQATMGGKYINSPETPLFKKSQTLFALNYAKAAMMQQRCALLVEGQIDALRLHVQGFAHTVAPLGTAFTNEHAQLLKRNGVVTVQIAFDGDSAGRKAALAAGSACMGIGLDTYLIYLDEGDDPDTILLREGPESFFYRCEKQVDFITAITHQMGMPSRLSPPQKAQLWSHIEKEIQCWSDPIVQQTALRQSADILGISPKITLQSTKPIAQSAPPKVHQIEKEAIHLLFTLFMLHPFTYCKRVHMLFDARLFKEEKMVALFAWMTQQVAQEKTPVLADALTSEKSELAQGATLLSYEKIDPAKLLSALEDVLHALRQRAWRRRGDYLSMRIQEEKYSEEAALTLAKEYSAWRTKAPERIAIPAPENTPASADAPSQQ